MLLVYFHDSVVIPEDKNMIYGLQVLYQIQRNIHSLKEELWEAAQGATCSSVHVSINK